MCAAAHWRALHDRVCGGKRHECHEGLGLENEAWPARWVKAGYDFFQQLDTSVLEKPFGPLAALRVGGEMADAVRILRFIGAGHRAEPGGKVGPVNGVSFAAEVEQSARIAAATHESLDRVRVAEVDLDEIAPKAFGV